MKKRKPRKKTEREAPDLTPSDQAIAGAVASSDDVRLSLGERVTALPEKIEKLSAESDSAWFLQYLTDQQIRFGIAYRKHMGDGRKALKEAGYAPGTKLQNVTENAGEAMYAFMMAIKAEVSLALSVDRTSILAATKRIQLKSEASGEYVASLNASKFMAELLGLVDKRGGAVVQINADGAQITIAPVRTKEDDVIDAEFLDVLALNGMEADGS